MLHRRVIVVPLLLLFLTTTGCTLSRFIDNNSPEEMQKFQPPRTNSGIRHARWRMRKRPIRSNSPTNRRRSPGSTGIWSIGKAKRPERTDESWNYAKQSTA